VIDLVDCNSTGEVIEPACTTTQIDNCTEGVDRLGLSPILVIIEQTSDARKSVTFAFTTVYRPSGDTPPNSHQPLVVVAPEYDWRNSGSGEQQWERIQLKGDA